MSEQPGSRWAPIFAYAGLSAANQMLWVTFAPVTTAAADHYGVSVEAIGWLAQIFPLLYVVLALPAGKLIDRFLPQGLALGAILTALGGAVRLIGDSFTMVLVGQILIAVGQPLVLNSVTKLSGSYLRQEDRTNGIAISSAGIFAGLVIALLLGALMGGDQLRALLSVQAAIGIITAAWLCLSLRRPGQHSPAVAVNLRLREVWADRYIRVLTVLVLAGFGVFIALTSWLQALLEPAGISEETAGFLLLGMVLAGVIGSAVLPERLARHRAEIRFVTLSIIAGAVACAVLALAPSFGTALPALVVIGVLLLTDLPVILELAERRAGAAGGTATGLLWLAGNLGGLIAALAVQALLGHPGVAFGLLALLLVVALPVLPLLRRYEPSTPIR